MYLKILILLLLSTGYCIAQSPADCATPVILKDTVWKSDGLVRGSGKVLEFKGYDLKDPYHFQTEHNTVWFVFKSLYNTEISLDIIPADPKYDIDFIVFKNEPGICEKIISANSVPVRSNLSRTSFRNGGITGLSFTSPHEYVVSGPGEPFSKSLSVKKDEEYLIVVDNLSNDNKGFTLKIHYKEIPVPKQKPKPVPVPPKDTVKAAPVEVIAPPKSNKPMLNIKIIDEKTGAPVKADLVIDITPSSNPIKHNDTSSIATEILKLKTYSISANSKGYLFSNSTFNSGPAPESRMVEIKMKKIEEGGTVTLQNIHFTGDGVEFLPSSKAALQNLYNFLVENENVKILILGHVNGPGSKNTLKHQKLSTDRAQAVYQYLQSKGISTSRLQFKGMGNTEMLFPEPLTDQESEANRRVEVRILSNKK